MRVAVLHNAVPDDAPPEDLDTLVQVDAVAGALTRLGHEPMAVACALDLAAMRKELLRHRAEMVFNLVESLAGADSLVYLPPAVLDVLGLPYAGSRTEALFLTTHKLLAKERMRQAGLPTPPWCRKGDSPIFIETKIGTVPSSNIHEGHEEHEKYEKDVNSTSYSSHTSHTSHSVPSWIIKGVWDQGSRGMDDDAVLRGPEEAELLKQLEERAKRSNGPCFAEQFIEGREFNLSVLGAPTGPESLPPAEIDFSAFPPDKPRIVGHRAKWLEDSFEFKNTPRRFDFDPADRPLLDRLCDLARQCWRLFRLRGWARVDFRVDASGQPWILEVNANPCLSPDAGFAAALCRASIPFDVAIRRILEDTGAST